MTIVWLNNDLRLNDNPAIYQASKKNEAIFFVYIWSPEEYGKWAPGAASRVWLYHSLKSLNEELIKHGNKLILLKGKAQECLEKLVREIESKEIFFNKRYEPDLLKRDEVLIEKFKKQNIKFNISNGSLLLDPSQIFNKQGSPFKVFTYFYKHIINRLPVKAEIVSSLATHASRGCQRTEAASLRKTSFCRMPHEDLLQRSFFKLNFSTLKNPQAINIPSLNLKDLNLISGHNWETKILKYHQIGEAEALKKLKTFAKNLMPDYTIKRDFPAIDGVSKLSSHLHFGEISPNTILKELQGQKNSEAFIRQIIWREFAHYILYHFPQSNWENFDSKFNKFPWSNKEYDFRSLTGYPIIDAGMRELWETGLMHNRVRMIVGSFMTKDLMLHWRQGAKWFWDTLVDADLANNSMGWQWVSGSGVDASPFFRIFNPITQSEKFDPEAKYLRRWLPELSKLPNKYIHKPFSTPPLILEEAGIQLGKTYPEPILNHDAMRLRALEEFKKLAKPSSSC